VGCVQQTLDYLASGQIKGLQMVTHRFGFGETKEAFDMVAEYKDGVMKAMVEF
jgi:L-iditol 2-dehydrogenase